MVWPVPGLIGTGQGVRDRDRADGRVRRVDKPFDVAGVQIRVPRDPLGPARHTINYGRTSLPFMASREVATPGRLPFSPAQPCPLRGHLDGLP